MEKEEEKKLMLSFAPLRSFFASFFCSSLFIFICHSKKRGQCSRLPARTKNSIPFTFLASFFSSECTGSDDRSCSSAAHSAFAPRLDASAWQAALALTCSGVRSGSSNPKWSTMTRSLGGMAKRRLFLISSFSPSQRSMPPQFFFSN